MRVAFVTDLHLLEKRLSEQKPVIEAIADEIGESGAKLCLIGGDLAGYTVPHRVAPAERNTLVWLVSQVRQWMPVVIIRGNHDSYGEWDFLRELDNVYFVDSPTVVRYATGMPVVIALPWVDQAQLDMAEDYSGAVLAHYLEHIGEAGVDGELAYVLAHGAFADSLLREGQPAVPTKDPVLSANKLVEAIERLGYRVEALFAGHYHLHQRIPCRRPAVYGGSTWPNSYGEEMPKGWTLYDTNTQAFQHREIKQRAKLKITVDPATATAVSCEPPIVNVAGMPLAKLTRLLAHQLADQDVRIVYQAQEADALDARAQVDVLAESMATLGMRVDIQPSIARSANLRDGAADVAEARTLAAKIEAWDAQRSTPSKPEFLEDVIQELVQLEREVPHG